MNKLLAIVDGKIEIFAEALMIREFKFLWDRDKTKDKALAISELSFVHHYADPKSVYLQFLDDYERQEAIAADVMTDPNWTADQFVMAACEKYRTLYVSEASEFLEAARKALHSLRKYFLEVDFSKLDDKGNLLYKIRDVTGALKDSEGILTSIQKLKERVELEEDVSITIRGGGKRGLKEDPE